MKVHFENCEYRGTAHWHIRKLVQERYGAANVHGSDRDDPRTWVNQCDAYVLIIDKQFYRGMERFERPEHPDRVSLECALELDVPIIPLLIMDAVMPRADQLPPSLRRITACVPLPCPWSAPKRWAQQLCERIEALPPRVPRVLDHSEVQNR
jgi:hypothetical protein